MSTKMNKLILYKVIKDFFSSDYRLKLLRGFGHLFTNFHFTINLPILYKSFSLYSTSIPDLWSSLRTISGLGEAS